MSSPQGGCPPGEEDVVECPRPQGDILAGAGISSPRESFHQTVLAEGPMTDENDFYKIFGSVEFMFPNSQLYNVPRGITDNVLSVLSVVYSQYPNICFNKQLILNTKRFEKVMTAN